jgi:ABC-type transport system involved in multi-copper enzyme maturation permease subunit
MLTNIRYILLTALRDKLFIGLIIGILAAAGISAMLGSTAMVEGDEMTATFSGGASRIILIIGLLVFVCFHIRQAFEQKEIDVLLSRPISRPQVMLSYWLGFCFVAFLMVLATATLLSFLPLLNWKGYAFWCISLLAESFIVVAIGLFAAFTLRSAVASVMASMGLYTIGRMMGFFIATSESKLLFDERWINTLLGWVLKGVSIVTPRLDLFTQSEWLVYGLLRPQDFTYAAIQAIIFTALLLLAAMIDFQRKQF